MVVKFAIFNHVKNKGEGGGRKKNIPGLIWEPRDSPLRQTDMQIDLQSMP